MKNETHLVFFFFFLVVPTAFSDPAAAKSALLTFRSAVGGRTLLWDPAEENPCLYHGVQCRNDVVVGLHLPGFSLEGSIPVGIFKNLRKLRTLSLRFNQLSGEIPVDLGGCSELRNLNLDGNRFSGEIPDWISSLGNLIHLSMASNEFSGELPENLGKLKRLRFLFLENNMLSGFLPELKLELDLFNVSYNRLNGSIPMSLGSMPESAFFGNKLCGKPLQICPGIAASTGVLDGEFRRKDKGLSGGVIAAIVIGSVVALAIVLMIIVFVCGKKRKKKMSKKTSGIDILSISKQLGISEIPEEKGGCSKGYPVYSSSMTSSGNIKVQEEDVNFGGEIKKLEFFGHGVGGKSFDLEDLLRASAEVLGKGTFGTTYKAVMELGPVMVVKRLRDVINSDTKFKKKIQVVGAMSHENLVPLRAYYYSIDEKLVVYDYMSMGSLSAFLHGNKGADRTPLNWEVRLRIALGISRGINYLHSQGSNISHGSLKSSNVLLTKSYEASLSDFCLAPLVVHGSAPNRANGYRAPEVTDLQRVSQKADVYSFGVLIMELLTGKPPTHSLLHEEGVDLPRWVQSVVEEGRTSSEVFDLDLLRSRQCEADEENMVRLLEIAIECSAQYPDIRPSMDLVINEIEGMCSK